MNRLSIRLLVLASSIHFAANALAQGSDDCTTPTVIVGTGSFAVSTSGASDSAQQSSTCPPARSDVWFSWTAAATQTITLSSCGGTTGDTVMAVYPGSTCPASGTQLACSDDSCALQSSLAFNATSGSTYLIQIGAWSAETFINGTFTLAVAVNTCGSGVGPDVITGDITSISNTNALNGIDAFTLGTTSCNIGNALVSWQGSIALHPVMCETAYKYKVVNGSGRFEQVGMSWLKHGSSTLPGTTCCPCQNPGTSQWLGIGCSDPYSSSQAAGQSGLRPRWQVNPHTGVFPYPQSNPAFSGNTARKTEIELTDLEPSSAAIRYFAECTYITQDDAQAGNGNNNASWKELTVTGDSTNYTFATTGIVKRMQPGISAWRVVEPAVKLTSVQVAGDGVIFVGSHATSLGGGQYHYEFAVHNMNADRGVGSFSVPIPLGATVTNVGFHDATYRNGDGDGNVSQSATDWPAMVGTGAVTWACETQAQNPNANAIRWQCTYNFRFDADVPPAAGDVTVSMWKVGSPVSVISAAEVPAGNAAPVEVCFGDGSGSACPCANESAPNSGGCLNSLGMAGVLRSSGNTSVSADSFVLHGTRMPDGGALYFQGTTQNAGGAGVMFGDGLLCASGVVMRLMVKINAGGASELPQAGDTSISILGANVIGGARVYQCWYSCYSAVFCQTETFNLTNAVQTTWQP